MNQRLNRGSIGSHISSGNILLIISMLMTLVLLTVSFFTDSNSSSRSSAGVMLTFALNGLLGIVYLVRSVVDKPFSLAQMHWFFFVTMFVIAPLSQYIFGYAAWGYPLSEDDYLDTNVKVLIWGLVFAVVSGIKRPNKQPDKTINSQKEFYDSLPLISKKAEIIAFAIAVCATAAVVSLVGFQNLFSRGDFITGLDKTASLVFEKFIRPLPVFAFVIIFVRAKQQRTHSFLLFAALALVFIADFPAGMARYNMACLYGALCLLLFRPFFEKRGLFVLALLFAFLVIFPASNSYRTASFTSSGMASAIVDAVLNLPAGFCAVDYDAYSMIARTSWYVDSVGIGWGYQLLGALLFFIPRAIWTTKPEASGHIVCEAQGQYFLDISSPLPAEGVINFGIAGLVAFAIIIAMICRKTDQWFWVSDSAYRLFYPFLYFLVFFVMRGALMSGLAFIIGYLCSFSCLIFLCLHSNERLRPE